MASRPAFVVAAQDQLEAGVRELTKDETLRLLSVIARNLDERGSTEKAALLRQVIHALRGWGFDLLCGDLFADDD